MVSTCRGRSLQSKPSRRNKTIDQQACLDDQSRSLARETTDCMRIAGREYSHDHCHGEMDLIHSQYLSAPS